MDCYKCMVMVWITEKKSLNISVYVYYNFKPGTKLLFLHLKRITT